MAERPDNPTGKPDKPTKSAPEPAADAPQDEEVVHHVSQRKKRKKGVGGEEMELQLTSMIDVIFQLLIYFVITANFQIDEGVILATLPGNAAETQEETTPPTPIVIGLTTTDDGLTYTLTLENRRVRDDSVTVLYGELASKVAGGVYSKEDDIFQIKAAPKVRWQHVVNVFNACVKAELEQVGFAP